MSFIHRSRSLLLLPAIVGLLAVVPHAAEAQGRRGGGRGPSVRSVVVIGGYRYQPYWLYDFYDPLYQWGPYPYPPYGRYGYGVRDELTSSVRLEVTPREAQVFVDGYIAGTVDDFDGIFQRLRLRPGGHQIALYLEGYRTVVQSLYLNQGADQKIRYTLERLRAGEVSDPPPPAAEQVPDQVGVQPGPRRPMPPNGQGWGPGQGVGPGPGQGPRGPAQPPSSAGDSGRFGTLSLRVQPGDADILIDGERWAAPAGPDRIAIQLSEGRHRIEVRKDGFAGYAEDVLIRRGTPFTLNVSLLRGGETGR